MPLQVRHEAHGVELGTHDRERRGWFGEDVDLVIFVGEEADNKYFGGNFVTNKMKIDFDLLDTSMEGGV